MIINTLSVILFLIFLVLGGLHFYWLSGGKWGLNKVIPTKTNTSSLPSIPKFPTLMVGLVLVLFGLFYLIKSKVIEIQLPDWIIKYGYWVIPSVFILRAIGDFNYVGFFKKIKKTEFAKADSKLFIPLCITIAIMGFLIQLIQ